MALFGPLIAPPEAARSNIRARAAKARSEGAAGMQDIAQALMNGAISADTRQRAPAAAAFVRESLMRQDPEGYARSCEALAGTRPAALDRIQAPTLLVTGDEDTVAPPQAVRAMAERLGQSAGQVRVAVFSRCGHWTPIERPEDCARELRDFLLAQH
jgi:pimeloyl-ACP methyl ester carboxylesterase